MRAVSPLADPAQPYPQLTPVEGPGVADDDLWVTGPAMEFSGPAGGDMDMETSEVALERRVRAPQEPTKQERIDHEEFHEPYRLWCPACVSGRGRVPFHSVVDRSNDAVPVLGIDYGYLTGRLGGDESQEPVEMDLEGRQCSPILCGRWAGDRFLVGRMFPCKGIAHSYCVDSLVEELRLAGYKKVFIRSDNEPALVALIRRAGMLARSEHGIEAVHDPARQGDKDANGLAEGGVKEVKAKCRVLKTSLEQLLNVRLTAGHFVLPFLVMQAVMSVNLGRRGPDGRTPYELRRGRPWHGRTADLGEKVHWLGLGARASRLDSGYAEGIYLGMIPGTSHYYVGIAGRIVQARAFKRMTETERRDPRLFESVAGTPWCLDPVAAALAADRPANVIPVHAHVEPVVRPEDLLAAVPRPEAPTSVRSVYIRPDVELKAYGYTPGCAGCDAAQQSEATGVKVWRSHSEVCRTRIMNAMKASSEANQRKRVRMAEERQAVAPVPQAAASSSSSGPMVVTPAGGTLRRGPEVSSEALQEESEVDRVDPRAAPTALQRAAAAAPATPDVPMGFLETCDRASVALYALTGFAVDLAGVYREPSLSISAFSSVPAQALALDLRTRPIICEKVDQDGVWQELEEAKPFLVLGGLPKLPQVQECRTMKDKKAMDDEHIRLGTLHLAFCCTVYTHQLQNGGLFLHEHVCPSWSLRLAPMLRLINYEAVETVTERRASGSQGRDILWVTNCKELAVALRTRQPEASAVSVRAGAGFGERFSPTLVDTILRAVRLRRVADGTLMPLEVGITAEDPEMLIDMRVVDDPSKHDFYDEYTGIPLPVDGVRAARREEMIFLRDLGAWRVLLRTVACANGDKPIRVRWIDHDKGVLYIRTSGVD